MAVLMCLIKNKQTNEKRYRHILQVQFNVLYKSKVICVFTPCYSAADAAH